MFQLFTMDNAKELEANRPLAQALTAEDYNPDSSSLPTYLRYFWQGGLSATVLILLLSLLGNPTLFLGYWWSQSMAVCSEKLVVFPSNASNVNQSQSSSCPWYFQARDPLAVGLMIFFTFFGSVCSFMLGFSFYYVALSASKRLHNLMPHRVLHCPMYFFDTN